MYRVELPAGPAHAKRMRVAQAMASLGDRNASRSDPIRCMCRGLHPLLKMTMPDQSALDCCLQCPAIHMFYYSNSFSVFRLCIFTYLPAGAGTPGQNGSAPLHSFLQTLTPVLARDPTIFVNAMAATCKLEETPSSLLGSGRALVTLKPPKVAFSLHGLSLMHDSTCEIMSG